MLRPVAEYGCVVFHSSLTDEQDKLLDRIRNQALKCIFGPFLSGRKMRQLADMPTLWNRRIHLCNKFAKKSLSNPQFAHWFSMKTAKTREIFLEEKAWCKGLVDSPLYYFRRYLNGKEGKCTGKVIQSSETTDKGLGLMPEFLFFLTVSQFNFAN